MWEYLKAILYGALEGVTEWLPISSTGHLILFGERLMPSALSALGEEFTDMLHVAVQAFAVLAVLVVYRAELLPCGSSRKAALGLWGRLALATLPTALVGLLAERLCLCLTGRSVDSLLFSPAVVAAALIFYGILFMLAELITKGKRTAEGITARHALLIGLFQSLAIIPGTSRSGVTLLGSRLLGISRESAARFSFFAAVPVIGAASLLKLVSVVSEGIYPPLSAMPYLLCAAVSAFAVSMLTLRGLTNFVKRHSFIPFGIYRIFLGAAVLLTLC